jgi:hypothetical protein
MSFNIRRGDADAGTPHAWQNRRSLVVELLRDSGAAIIGLQEVGSCRIKCPLQRCRIAVSRCYLSNLLR